jgi:hypothetical protein
MASNENLRSIHLHDQAQAFGCQVQTYPESDAIFLRNLPGDLAGDVHFEQFVELVRSHNLEAIKTWKQQQ